jgi:NADH-quinone oxidoreductase subunit I
MGEYFHNVYSAIRTILIGMRITLRYQFAKTITLQYPDVAPALQKRYRGFHWYEIEKCIACDQCAKACPVDCIYIEKTGPRKVDKESGVAKGGAMTRYAIDYSKCMFCALCVPPCPTDCIHMGNLHDMSGFDRNSMIVEFTELAKDGLQTPQPLWMQKDQLPDWAEARKKEWLDSSANRHDIMLEAMTETKAAPKPKPAAKPKPDAAKPDAAKAEAPKTETSPKPKAEENQTRGIHRSGRQTQSG